MYYDIPLVLLTSDDIKFASVNKQTKASNEQMKIYISCRRTARRVVNIIKKNHVLSIHHDIEIEQSKIFHKYCEWSGNGKCLNELFLCALYRLNF